MLENVGTAFRKFLLVIVVILAAALFVSVLTVLVAVITIAVIAIVFALIIAPKETKDFFNLPGRSSTLGLKPSLKLFRTAERS